MEKSFFLKGDICWSSSPCSIETAENSYLLCIEGKSGGVFKNIPAQYDNLPVRDHAGKLIMPGLTDLHVHAPQFAFRALGMDLELLEWLNTHAFPEEAKYRDMEYAHAAYSRFVEEIKKGPNTRLCVFATIHTSATMLLADLLEESGLVSFVGKVSMNRNCPDYLSEDNAAAGVREWLEFFFRRVREGCFKNTAPIITPRFIPSCSDDLLKSLAEIQNEYGLPLQSHLSENRREIEWVKELCPESKSYAGAYADFGLLEGPAVMAHCVWPEESEEALLAEKGIYIAHCPQSNANLSSGIAPVKRLTQKGIPVGLGSDVAGGAHTSIFRAMSDAIQVSKLRRIYAGQSFNSGSGERRTENPAEEKALTLEEAFYLGTASGGSFFGKRNAVPNHNGAFSDFGPAGSFAEGWDFDALVIDDSGLNGSVTRSQRDRLERVVYLSDDRHIAEKYVRGRLIKK